MRKFSKSTTGAASEAIILLLLKHKPMHGYALQKGIKELTNDKIDRKAGSMYPLLAKMERKGWIKSKWEEPVTERPRKIYSLQKKGLKELEEQMEEWYAMFGIFDALSNPE